MRCNRFYFRHDFGTIFTGSRFFTWKQQMFGSSIGYFRKSQKWEKIEKNPINRCTMRYLFYKQRTQDTWNLILNNIETFSLVRFCCVSIEQTHYFRINRIIRRFVQAHCHGTMESKYSFRRWKEVADFFFCATDFCVLICFTLFGAKQ